jgi:DNA-binding response OmpR family regulator
MTDQNVIPAEAGRQDDMGDDKIRILIVEDSSNINMLYDHGLPDAVFEKRFATNGQEGLVIYNDWQPEIMILDVMLPVVSGYMVLKEIRQKLQDSSTVIIMSTSLSGKEDVTMFMKMGIQGYILKPFGMKEIGGKILTYYQKVHPKKASAALAVHERIIADLVRNAMKSKLSPKAQEMDHWLNFAPDFTADEFSDAMTVEAFCRAFDTDRYDVTVKADNNTLDKINELLQIPALCDKIMENEKADLAGEDIKKIISALEPHRGADYANIPETLQNKIRAMNRLLLKAVYPDALPENRLIKTP